MVNEQHKTTTERVETLQSSSDASLAAYWKEQASHYTTAVTDKSVRHSPDFDKLPMMKSSPGVAPSSSSSVSRLILSLGGISLMGAGALRMRVQPGPSRS